MLASISQLDASLTKQFKWLPREYLRKIFETAYNPAFGNHRILKAAKNTQLRTHATPAQGLQPLFESASKTTVAGVSVDVSKVVQQLARCREDVLRKYTQDSNLDSKNSLHGHGHGHGSGLNKIKRDYDLSFLLDIFNPVNIGDIMCNLMSKKIWA